jgi:hypothetical protein
LIAACGGIETEYFDEGTILARDVDEEAQPNIRVGPADCGFVAYLRENTTIRVVWSDGTTEPAAADQLALGVYVRVFQDVRSGVNESCPAGVAAGIIEIVAEEDGGVGAAEGRDR